MNTIEQNNKTTRVTRLRANAGDELGLLVNLLRKETIGYRMLLRNVAEIVADDYNLVVCAVLIITDKARIADCNLTEEDFEDVLAGVRCAPDFKGKATIIAAISDAMQTE